MSQVTQSVAANLVVLLSKASVSITSLEYTDVTVQYRKEGQSAFTVKTLAAEDFTEIGDGCYIIAFTAAELNTLGTFTVMVQGAAVDPFVTIKNVVAATTAITGVSLETCTITGHVADAGGNPKVGVAVSAQLLGMPSIEQSQAVLADDMITVLTDASGTFFLPLVRLADVEIFIPVANYRRRVTVPNAASADLFTGVF